MIELPVTLRHSDRRQRAACAVLLPGGDAAQWLKQLHQAGASLTVRLFLILEDPLADQQIVGVLCPVPADAVIRFDERLPRYGVIAGRLYLPTEAEFDPPVCDGDWESLLPEDASLFVWHPYLGLVRFEAAQQRRSIDLLQPPEERLSDWNAALPGSALNARLYSLQAETLPSIEDILQSGQEDIGSRSNKPSELPRAPGESKWKSIAAAPLAPFAAMGNWLSKQISQFGAGNAGSGRSPRVTPYLQKQRERELERLLNTLKNDPDEGLKYALPMSNFQGRGVAPPGGRLVPRNVDFQLRAGGSGPVDSWWIRFELQQQLLNRYREAAEREVRLGRYRRAAYIHAELLGNFSAAASVLEQGQHYHEAAVLYRDKLKRPIDAARCLERGGLLPEAIEIYDELKQHVKVGELYLRLEDVESARGAFRRAVDERLAHDDRIAAAELLITRLDDAEAAFEVLEQGWPNSSQRVQCLKTYFELLGRRGEHLRAAGKLNELREQTLSVDRLLDLTTVLSGVATGNPDRSVAAQAADATRVVAAKHLAISHRPSLVVLQSLARLAPEDKLLQRDCVRFGQVVISRTPVSPGKPPALKRVSVELVRSIALPTEYEWMCAQSVGDHYYLVGHDGAQTLILLRGLWSDPKAQQSVIWKGPGADGGIGTTFLNVDEGNLHVVKVVRLNRPGLPPRLLPTTTQFVRTTAETPGWIPPNILGITTLGGATWVVDSQLVLTAHNRAGVTTSHIDLHQEFMDQPLASRAIEPPLPMHARSNSLSIAIDRKLLRFPASGAPRSLEFPGRIRAVTGSLPHTRERLLVMYDTGVSLLFPTLEDFDEQVIEDQTSDLLGTFLRDGRVVLWSPVGPAVSQAKVYSTALSRAALQGTAELRAPHTGFVGNPLMLLKTDVSAQFAVIPQDRGGHIQVWSITGG